LDETTNEFEGTLEEFYELDDNRFAQEWKFRYMAQRAQMLPEIARWMRLLRFFHPRELRDHWQDQFGNALPKLWQSQGLSLEIYNWCRPIIEVYGSLLAGQKPLPFQIDVPPQDPNSESSLFRADAQEKVLMDEIYNQKIPLHFLDFCTSVMLFGIGYVYSWIDPVTRHLKTQVCAWPGDVLPQWGSDHYGSGSDGIESVILTERVSLDAASRRWPEVEFVASQIDLLMRPDSIEMPPQQPSLGSCQILKIWWRWNNEKGAEKIGYAEVAYDGTRDGEPKVLYRDDDTGYPDIPLRWAARFNTPGEPPHRAAGVLDDIVGINTEYDEKLSAFADMIQKLVYTKYKGKGFNIGNVPRLAPGSNIYPMGLQQDLLPLTEQINNYPFDSFLARLETMMLTISGLSKLMMGAVTPGDTSGEALNNLMHASIGRLEVVRTPIQWAWMGLIDEVWVPLLSKFYKGSTRDNITGKNKNVRLDFLFQDYTRIHWTWPDVTPRDAIRAAQVAMELGRGGYISDESVRQRVQVPSPVDEEQKIRKERQDKILHPEAVRNTALAEMTLLQVMQAAMMGGQPMGAAQDANAKMGASVADANMKAEASRTPMMDEAQNTPQGSLTNAAQGYKAQDNGV